MTTEDPRYPVETLDEDEDDGTMPGNMEVLGGHVIGHRIVSAEEGELPELRARHGYYGSVRGLVLTLDDGTKVLVADSEDCCAYTSLNEFFLDPASVDHVIIGVGSTEAFTTWHIYADWGDILRLQLGWSCGNPFYYGYGFDIAVVPGG